MRIVLATFVGIIVAFTTIGLMEVLGHKLFPLPFDIDPENPQDLQDKMHLVPVGAFIAVIVAHVLAMIFALIVARLIDKKTRTPLFIIFGFLLYGAIANIFMTSQPLWFAIADILAISAVGLLFISRIKKSTPQK